MMINRDQLLGEQSVAKKKPSDIFLNQKKGRKTISVLEADLNHLSLSLSLRIILPSNVDDLNNNHDDYEDYEDDDDADAVDLFFTVIVK